MTIDFVQGSDEWLQIRLGHATGSRISDVVAKSKSGTGWGDSRRSYRKQLAIERIKGRPRIGLFKNNAAMQQGNEREPLARQAYIEETTFNRGHRSWLYSSSSYCHGRRVTRRTRFA